MLIRGILELLFPPKCILCRQVLESRELDLCHACRKSAPAYKDQGQKLRHIRKHTAVWYYEDHVRQSILRYKFHNARSYACGYGRVLAMQIQQNLPGEIQVITWVPVSKKRKRRRGYDQVELIAQAVSRELALPLEPLLVKHRDNKPNSSLETAEQRRANVLGVYRAASAQQIKDKRILLIDDILTTGATASECARVLLSAEAKEVYFAAVAAGRKRN